MHVAVDAVGSLRARITVRGPGGHSWANRGRPSAIDEICRIARTLSRQPRGDASTNIGLIRGGTAINAIAAQAELVIEQRALDEALLARFARAAARCSSVEPPLTLEVEEVGRRPAGRLDRREPLLATVRAVREELGLPDELVAASTDANAALAAGIPALCLGCAQGGEMHTPEEFIEIASLAAGREQLRGVLDVAALGESAGHERSAHPLDPLGADEIERAVACVRARTRARRVASRFVSVELREPDKAELAAWRAGGGRRRARPRSSCSPAGCTHEAIVALEGELARGLGARPGRAGGDHGRRVRRVRGRRQGRRGLPRERSRCAACSDLDARDGRHVVGRAASRSPGARVGRALAWLRSDLTGDNGYARPIGGLIALVDLDRMRGRARSTTTASCPCPRSTATTATAAGGPTATICARSRSPSRRARACGSTGALSAGARGAFASASTRASR